MKIYIKHWNINRMQTAKQFYALLDECGLEEYSGVDCRVVDKKKFLLAVIKYEIIFKKL